MRSTSAVNGQGIVRYACKSECSCYKAGGRKCNSRYHKSNNKCTNHDD